MKYVTNGKFVAGAAVAAVVILFVVPYARAAMASRNKSA